MPACYSDCVIDIVRPQPTLGTQNTKREVGVHSSIWNDNANRLKLNIDSSHVLRVWLECNVNVKSCLTFPRSRKFKSDNIPDSSLFQVNKLAATRRSWLNTKTFDAILQRARKEWVCTSFAVRVVAVSLVLQRASFGKKLVIVSLNISTRTFRIRSPGNENLLDDSTKRITPPLVASFVLRCPKKFPVASQTFQHLLVRCWATFFKIVNYFQNFPRHFP